jgi:hypothetical protein
MEIVRQRDTEHNTQVTLGMYVVTGGTRQEAGMNPLRHSAMLANRLVI